MQLQYYSCRWKPRLWNQARLPDIYSLYAVISVFAIFCSRSSMKRGCSLSNNDRFTSYHVFLKRLDIIVLIEVYICSYCMHVGYNWLGTYIIDV
ncbi:hypothetical protein F4776DRAFT_629791 [Hypoxylon sp. NC0597]|nr:hypothetical protein F4776DRAFT_629791 [Hypoxylon sp. NC0597]